MRDPAAQVTLDFAGILFDVDGTLIDSNDAHAEAWTQALNEHHVVVDLPTVRRLIGMGGDKLLPAVAHVTEESPEGKAIGARKKVLFAARLPSLRQTRGASALLDYLRSTGIEVAIASSADDHEIAQLLAQAGIDQFFPKKASKRDAAASKPDPGIVEAAIAKVKTPRDRLVMIGDTPYDVEAASRAGLRTIALRCGGYWSDADLAAASRIDDDPEALLASLQAADVSLKAPLPRGRRWGY
jgi:beta-phosphoglucomutase-like phosphatase (HAD superfamily)